MIRNTGPRPQMQTAPSVAQIRTVPQMSLSETPLNMESAIERMKASAEEVHLEMGGRPTNIQYRLNQTHMGYWGVYSQMNYLFGESEILATIRNRFPAELLRHGVVLAPRFALKCTKCGYESKTLIKECPECGGRALRRPDPGQKEYFKNGRGRSFLDEANHNGQSLLQVLRAYAEQEIMYNQSYLVCITGDRLDSEGRLIEGVPDEFVVVDPKFVRYLYDQTGKPGRVMGFTREDRQTGIELKQGAEDINDYTPDGKVIYAASWAIGESYGATGPCWYYTDEEVYQDKWFNQSMTYGVPLWMPMIDSLKTGCSIEKRLNRQYTYGVVRKVLVFHGLSESDAEDISKGLKDILATDSGSVPIICLPPQMPQASKMEAQALDLMDASVGDSLDVLESILRHACALVGMPDVLSGGQESSAGSMGGDAMQMNIFDRYLGGILCFVDRMCDFMASFFPLMTDWVPRVVNPFRDEVERQMENSEIERIQKLKALGLSFEYRNGKFWPTEEPADAGPQLSGAYPMGTPFADNPDPGTPQGENPELNASQKSMSDSDPDQDTVSG